MKLREKMIDKKTFFIVLSCLFSIFLLIYLAITLLSNQSLSPNNQAYQEVIEIIDGDTFRTIDGEIIRLLCVDTPEKGEENYDEAMGFLGGRLLYSDIRLEGNETDKYGRSLRWVYVDDVLVNKEIIDLGFGTLFEYDGEDCELVK